MTQDSVATSGYKSVGYALTGVAFLFLLTSWIILSGSLLQSTASQSPVIWKFNAYGERLVETFLFAVVGSGIIAASLSFWLATLRGR